IGRVRISPRAPRPVPPTWVLKTGMSVTGIVFALFVFVHMIGNLKIFQGEAALNSYAHWLRTAFYPLLPHEGLLWILRSVLSVALVVHVVAAVMLWYRGRRARGPHRRTKMRGSRSFLARTMPITGLILLFFVVFHILDLTLGAQPAAPEAFQAATESTSSAYANVVASHERWWSAGIYIVTMLALALHLAHGVFIAVADLGATGRRFRAVVSAVAGIVAVAVLVGNALIPISVLAGWIS
ncbi:MAG: succinate dehydrogenase cytochrome b subunit, partial [Actinomycetaceae bacterium]